MIIQGDCLEVLKTMETGSIDCIVTSPPYWSLRDYGVEGQLGLEPRFQDYIEKLLIIFDECKRVLKNEGTLWVNLGDTYAGTMPKTIEDIGRTAKIAKNIGENYCLHGTKNQTVKDKSLIGIPDRFKIAMIDNGWVCRNDIIWHKPNAMPSSATDRFTVDYERLFFFTKQGKYYFKQLKVPAVDNMPRNRNHKPTEELSRAFKGNPPKGYFGHIGTGYEDRNMRTVWTINTKSYKDAHFAVFPEELPKRCIESGCPKGGTVLDIFCGSGTTGVQAKKQGMEFIGIELNPEYVELANKRIEAVQNLFSAPQKEETCK